MEYATPCCTLIFIAVIFTSAAISLILMHILKYHTNNYGSFAALKLLILISIEFLLPLRTAKLMLTYCKNLSLSLLLKSTILVS